MLPVLGGEVEERQQHVGVLLKRHQAPGYFGPYSTANRLTASRTCARVSEYVTSRSVAFTRGC